MTPILLYLLWMWTGPCHTIRVIDVQIADGVYSMYRCEYRARFPVHEELHQI